MNPIDTPSRERLREHREALDVLRTAKNAFFVLAAAAVLLQLVSWLIVQSGREARTDRNAWMDSLVANEPDAAAGNVRPWADRMEAPLIAAGFAGFAAVLVLLGIFVISLLVSLSAVMGGAAQLTRAAVWTLVAMALVMPWVRINPAQLGGLDSFFDKALAALRFGVCPVLVLGFLFLAQHQYRIAYRKITSVPPAKLPIHEV